MPGRTGDPLAAFRDLLPRLAALLTVVSIAWAMVAGLAGGNDGGEEFPAGPGDGSSVEDPGYQPPSPDVQLELETIRSELMQAVLSLRHEEGVPPVVMDIDLQIHAQDWAERTAVVGREDPSPANVTMVQANLPWDQASGHAFLEQWLYSRPHTEVLLNPAHSSQGVGLAVGQGRVWVVLQFTS